MTKKINYREKITRECKKDRSVKTGSLSNLVMVLKNITEVNFERVDTIQKINNLEKLEMRHKTAFDIYTAKQWRMTHTDQRNLTREMNFCI